MFPILDINRKCYHSLHESEKVRINAHTYDYVNQLASYDLLLIDDFGLIELYMDKCRNLFEIIETRDNKKPTMIVFQLPVAKWWNLFKDNT